MRANDHFLIMRCLQYFFIRKGNHVTLKLHYASTKLRGITLRTTVLFIIIPARIEKNHTILFGL